MAERAKGRATHQPTWLFSETFKRSSGTITKEGERPTTHHHKVWRWTIGVVQKFGTVVCPLPFSRPFFRRPPTALLAFRGIMTVKGEGFGGPVSGVPACPRCSNQGWQLQEVLRPSL